MADRMESIARGPASFFTQANALLRKNLNFQKRNMKTNIRLVFFPVWLCILLVLMQKVIDDQLNKPKYRCGCSCIDTNGDGTCENVCGVQYSTLDQVGTCAIPSPPEWPSLLQVPRPEYRAVKTGAFPSTDLPDEACKKNQSCPATVLFTGRNKTFAERVVSNFLTSASSPNLSNYLSTLSDFISGTDAVTTDTNFIEPAFISDRSLYTIQSQCLPNSTFSIPIQIAGVTIGQKGVKCVQGLSLWRNSSLAVNDELYKGFRQSNTERKINEIMSAYDFLDTNVNNYNVRIWYNSTYKNDSVWQSPIGLVRASRSLNVISNAYLRLLAGDDMKMQLEFIKEMPKPATRLTLDFSSLLSAVFFNWVIELLFPVIMTYLVYEKQHKLRLMMKMHGLGDGPYWVISYSYFLFISSVYMLLFVVFGSLIGLKFFKLNDYSIQFVFYFLFINLQIVLAFLAATFFSDVKTAQAIAYIYIFGSGLLAGYLFVSFVQDASFSRNWVRVMEIFPAFALYRGLYEFGQYSFLGGYMGTSGMRWGDLNDGTNGMREVLIIIFVEWLVLLPVAYYLDQVAFLGNRVQNPLSFLKCFRRKIPLSFRRSSFHRQGSKVFVEMEKPDVVQEREIVEQLLVEPSASYAIVCNNLKKVYPGRDGNPDKLAVRGLSLALPLGECFGMLGPNGAGKTSFINMMIGLVKPTTGNAYVQGFDIRTDMDRIYTSMGVCPQHDMLWEMLTGREHLLFYGRLKNLKGSELSHAVDESLKNVNLFHGGVGDKQARKYSGGMKRRLSVAISLIGDPKVVYMDEPSTGLDPASRNNLWNVVKRAKQNRAIVLTTHSMEEAEVLCDRLGIFVDGSLQCIGNPNQLKGRYGGSYVFTMTTGMEDEEEVEKLVRGLSTNAHRVYHISGTQKFEIPKSDVRIADVFQAVEDAKSKFPVQAWGLADTTLEDVFIKVARSASDPSAALT
uniref:ABC transporter A family member 7 n=1 Tax=Anthurium amnicola TaxID=1678845 RepID=A0A1D1XY01_9ARAE